MIASPITTFGYALGMLLAALLIIAMLCIAPLLLFWSIGELFGISVPFTFWTWLAAVVLLTLVRGGK